MHPHTKFGIPTSKNIGDMHRTRNGTDGRTHGRTDGRTDSAITICLPKFLWGHKNLQKMTCTDPKIDVANINAYIKFGEILSICSQDIERKQTFGLNQGP